MGRFAIERPGKDGQLHDRNATRVTEYVVSFSPTLQLATCGAHRFSVCLIFHNRILQ